MSVSQVIFKIISYILLSIAFLLLFFKLNEYIKNQAIDGCARNSSYTKDLPGESAKATYPITDLYEQCLIDKGIK